MKKQKSFLESTKATTAFALFALISGFLFLNKGMTGNIILEQGYSPTLLSVIGLLLVLCSAILGIYTIKNM